MDGFAYAIEALVGKAIGGKNQTGLKQAVLGTLFWSFIICVGLTFAFGYGGNTLIGWLTDIDSVRSTAGDYLPWLVAMPLVSMWGFLLDGLFIGATKGTEMRNSMLFSLISFFMVFLVGAAWENHALWLAMLVFMAVRGISMTLIFKRQWQDGRFFDIHPTL
jgi:multidrug resistance protein, MATE family